VKNPVCILSSNCARPIDAARGRKVGVVECLALHARRPVAGFSLVEVLVALVIGMIAVVVILQTFAQFEGQKRTTTSGDDSISSGSVSVYGLQRDLQQAGWGLSAIQVIGCTVSGLTAGAGSIPFAPVTINPAAITGEDPNTDTLLIVSGNGNGTVEGDQILSGAGTSYAVHTPSAFAVNDFVVAAPLARAAGACTLNATQIATVTASNVTVLAASASFTVAPSDRLFLLGATPVVRAYAIRGGNLTVCDWRVNDCGSAANNGDTSIWVPIANNVVSLRAEYGRDTATGGMDGIRDVWDQTIPTTATPISTVATKNLGACAYARIQAVRFGMVARSTQPEKQLAGGAHVTVAAPVWAGSNAVAVAANSTEAAAVAFNLTDASLSPSVTWPTWQDFRYKVFETVVPLRNITSQGGFEEC
jgi:type IV pilus assembly protein PilW